MLDNKAALGLLQRFVHDGSESDGSVPLSTRLGVPSCCLPTYMPGDPNMMNAFLLACKDQAGLQYNVECRAAIYWYAWH